jgi:uncharacterized protein
MDCCIEYTSTVVSELSVAVLFSTIKKAMPRISRFTIIFFLLLVGPSWSQGEFPDPRGYVSDFADIISPQDEDRMTAVIAELKEKTTAEIAVVTMPDIGGQSEEIYANRLFAAWGIGVQGEDNGILLLVALQERRFRIETGYGLEGILPDGLLGQISDQQIIPHLRQGRYGEGLLSGTLAIAQIIAQDAGITLSSDVDLPTSPVGTIPGERSFRIPFLLIILLIFFIFGGRMGLLPLLFLGGMPRGRGGFGGRGFGGGFGGFGGGLSGGGGVSRGF